MLDAKGASGPRSHRILGQVEFMKIAVQEQLETQKIYTDAT